MKDIVGSDHLGSAKKMIKTISTYKDAEDLINIGAYADGSDFHIDYAKKMIGKFNTSLQPDIQQKAGFDERVPRLKLLFEEN